MKQILQKLKQIKKYCTEHDNFCSNCVYRTRKDCRIQMVADLLVVVPDEWDLEKVEEILNESGR